MVNVICSTKCFWGALVSMARLTAVGWRSGCRQSVGDNFLCGAACGWGDASAVRSRVERAGFSFMCDA